MHQMCTCSRLIRGQAGPTESEKLKDSRLAGTGGHRPAKPHAEALEQRWRSRSGRLEGNGAMLEKGLSDPDRTVMNPRKTQAELYVHHHESWRTAHAAVMAVIDRLTLAGCIDPWRLFYRDRFATRNAADHLHQVSRRCHVRICRNRQDQLNHRHAQGEQRPADGAQLLHRLIIASQRGAL